MVGSVSGDASLVQSFVKKNVITWHWGIHCTTAAIGPGPGVPDLDMITRQELLRGGVSPGQGLGMAVLSLDHNQLLL